MKYQIKPQLTREYLLKYVSEEEIFEHYLNFKVDYNKKVLNSYRGELDASVSFKRYTNLIMTDWSGWFKGDCVKLVQFLFKLTFREALNRIYDDMIAHTSNRKIRTTHNKETVKEVKSKETVIRVKIQTRFSERAFQYWEAYNISSRTLAKYRVYEPEIIWLNDEIIWTDKTKELCFGYFLGQDANNREMWKIYYPERDTYRFISNASTKHNVQGWNQLTLKDNWRKDIIITKSLKDTMVIDELEIDSISVGSESEQIPEEMYKYISSYYENIYILFDNDKAGSEGANKFMDKYPSTNRLEMPEGTKDISDYIKENGKNKTQELIKWFLNI